MAHRNYFNNLFFFNAINNSVILIKYLSQIFVVIFRNDAACLRELRNGFYQQEDFPGEKDGIIF